MKTIKETLQEMDELLSDESKWTQHVNARDQAGNNALARGKGATCWCLSGAALRILDEDTTLYWQTLTFLESIAHAGNIAYWNDSPERTFQEVKDLLTKAKESL